MGEDTYSHDHAIVMGPLKRRPFSASKAEQVIFLEEERLAPITGLDRGRVLDYEMSE